MKKEDLKLYLIAGVAVLTLLNTVLLLTMDTGPELGSASPAKSEKPAIANNQPTAPVNIPADNNISATLNNNQPANVVNPTENSGPLAAVKFEKYEHDFGTVKALTSNKYKFRFTNTGDVPLTIQDARASCGCTVPSWPKEPIMPNQSSEIEVEFSPKENQTGVQEKTVTITANTPEQQTILKIKANVVK
jgi:hypothetical protein